MIRIIPLTARDPHEPHRASSPIELLFDLVTVIAIAAVTAGLHHAILEGRGVEMLPRFAFLFTAIWWAWMNFTWFSSAFENDGGIYRLLVMVVMIGEMIFAGGAGFIERTLDMEWGVLGWSVMRLGMAALWLCAASNPEYRTTALRYMWGILIAQLGWLVLYLSTAPGSSAFFAGSFIVWAIELSVPFFAERARRTPFHRHHIMERYAGLTIISLGELMVSVAAGFGLAYGANGTLVPWVASVSAVVIIFAVFAIYFAPEEGLRSRSMGENLFWGYGHVLVFAGIAMLGAALGASVDHAAGEGEATQAAIAWWFAVPLALIWVTLWLIRDRKVALGGRGLALPVGAGLALLGGVLGLPIWGFAVIAVIAQIWRAPLLDGRGQEG
ncbi:low temperature requirement protein A [Paracoccus aminophilus]|uniref:Low temperature requirement protein LtrA n=1 Tax=Paracoccus aminophilus JCM 7686 TaxID=1367847 RepID=S5YDW5_PARAH|nr:low temperature requirement protein A [Paracoccus aminophilus]AGT09658.1 low temperature requirement protein LtrA [Paracoccus aminophilus JCM 7686]